MWSCVTLLTWTILAEQMRADAGGRDWAYVDPGRVAAEAFADLLHAVPPGIRELSRMPGKISYRCQYKGVRYVVEVIRPYWLAFYAKDPHRVVWTTLGAHRALC